MYVQRDCSDVANDAARSEFAAAYLLQHIPSQSRFQLWMNGLRLGDGYAHNFPPLISPTGLFDTDSTVVRDAVLGQRSNARSDPSGSLQQQRIRCRGRVLLGSSADEATLKIRLDDAYNRLTSTSNRRELSIIGRIGISDVIRDGTSGQDKNGPPDALECLVCLALSWLHVSQQAAAVPPDDITLLPDAAPPWMTPRIPGTILAAGVIPALQAYAPARVNGRSCSTTCPPSATAGSRTSRPTRYRMYPRRQPSSSSS